MDTEKIKQGVAPGVWGVIIGAAAVAIIGFNWGGWVTGSTAKEMTATAIVDRLVPICVERANADPNKVMKLAAMKKVDSWTRGEFVAKQGWATLPGAKEADSDVAEGCASKIMP